MLLFGSLYYLHSPTIHTHRAGKSKVTDFSRGKGKGLSVIGFHEGADVKVFKDKRQGA